MQIDTSWLDDLHIVRKMRETIRKWWTIEISATDESGFVVDHATGVIKPPHNPICAACLAYQPEGLRRCNKSIERGVKSLAQDGTIAAELCGKCHMGIDIVAVPIMIEGNYKGSIFACGFLIDEKKEEVRERVKANVSALGLQVGDPDAAFNQIATVPEKDLGKFKDMLQTTAEEIVVYATTVAQKDSRITELQRELGGRYQFANIIGKSAAMQRLFSLLEKIVASDSTVLVTGENGTGKELIAKALHFNGPRKDKAFVVQNCSALNDNLLESELFGHVKGAFTGAGRDKQGLFKVADGGTFFLDEVGDMSAAMQVKLLRVLQEGTFIPVGATRADEVDVRIITATNRNLREMVERRQFREDLYYRLNVLAIEVPPLRDRKEDLELLVKHFLNRHAARTQRPPKIISPELLARFYEYHWPGNIRELENEIERVVVLSGDKEHIGPELRMAGASPYAEDRALQRFREKGDMESAVAALEKEMIQHALVACQWNKTQVAKKLGVSRTTLIKKIQEYGLEEAPRAR